MSFYELSLKMLRKNFAKYRLYFVCCTVSAAVFFCFASMLFDERFMDGYTVDSMISSNLVFPGMLAGVFVCLFLPLSYHTFWNARKGDYGIFLSLGMSRREAAGRIAAESVCVAALGLLAAFFAGTACSCTFYGILRYVLCIDGWGRRIPLKAYACTALLYGTVTTATVAAYAGRLMRMARIGGLLKNHERPEKSGALSAAVRARLPQYVNRNLIRFSFLMRHKRDWRLRSSAAGVMVAVIVCLCSLSVCIFGGLKRDAELYAPFDLVYASLFGYNDVSVKEAEEFLNRAGVVVTDATSIRFFRDQAFNYVSASELNEKLHTDFAVGEGTFLNLFQVVADDGYGHDLTPVERVSPGGRQLVSCGRKLQVLWNKNPAFADRTLVLSDADFELLSGEPGCWQGTMQLFSFQECFQECSRVKGAVRAFADVLRQSSGLSQEEQRTLAVTSRISDLERAGQSGCVLLLSMSFVVLLMCAAAFSLIHFQIAGEREENGKSVKSLRLMGCQRGELRGMFLFKNRVRFLVPVVAGSALSCLPCYFLNRSYRFGWQGVLLCIASGGVMAALVWKGMEEYSRREYRMLEDVENLSCNLKLFVI